MALDSETMDTTIDATTDATTSAPARPPERERLRLHYLDGLRGVAALHVVLLHAFVQIAYVKDWLPIRWANSMRWALDGRVPVQIFIALSGYCLMLPVARAGHLQGGKLGFVQRRARRILPPYYAALALSLAVILFVPGMGTPNGLRSDETLPATTPGVLLSHLFLFQDLSPNWISKIQIPMWTISQEWHIYFIFAFLLLPIWRYAGILTALAFASVVSVFLERHPFGYDLKFAAPHFLGVFAVGMFAATVSFPGSSAFLARLRDRVPWAWPTAGLWLAYLVLRLKSLDNEHANSLPCAIAVAAAVFCTLLLCTQAIQQGRANCWTLRFFEWKPVVILGTFSYSLYLVHYTVLSLLALWLHRWHVPGPQALCVIMSVGVLASVAVAYGFHLVFERPFMRGHPRTLPRAEKAAVLDTAP